MNQRSRKLIFTIGIIVFFLTLWDNPYVQYLKNLIVFIHESFHAYAAIATGGNIASITLIAPESGLTTTEMGIHGFPFYITVSAGYLGTTSLGAILLNRSFQQENPGKYCILIGLFLLISAFSFTTYPGNAFFIGSGWAVFLLFLGILDSRIARMLLIFLGTFLCLYSLYDLLDFTRNITTTDAGLLATNILKLPYFQGRITIEDHLQLSYFIAIIWTAINLRILYGSFKKTFLYQENHSLPTEIMTMKEHVKKGTVSPELAEWFFKKGLDFNGKPLNGDYISDKFFNNQEKKNV